MKNMFSDDSARVGTYDIFYGYGTMGTESWSWYAGTVSEYPRGTERSVWYGGYGVLVRWYWSLGTVGTVQSVWYGGYGVLVAGIGLLVRWVRYSRYGTVGTESW